MGFLEVRKLDSSGIMSSRLGVSKDGADGAVYVLHGSSRAHNTRSRRELSLSNVVRHVIQGQSRSCSGDGGGGFRIIRRNRREDSWPGPTSRTCISMRMTPLVRIMQRCRNDAAEKFCYATRCIVYSMFMVSNLVGVCLFYVRC